MFLFLLFYAVKVEVLQWVKRINLRVLYNIFIIARLEYFH